MDAPRPDHNGAPHVQRKPGRGRLLARGCLALALALGAGALAWLFWASAPPRATHAVKPPGTATTASPPPRDAVRMTSTPSIDPAPGQAGSDPNDLASYFRPGDPTPTAAELITALREAGVHEGIAAFNPPGTRPPLEGLAVPEGFELPHGYLRHHQASDGGEAIPPILMFDPDVSLYDRHGNPIPIPPDRVVPPEYAPAGLPLRWVRLPPGP